MNAARGGSQRLGKHDAVLLARAVAFTRVSYFTPQDLQRLRELVATLTGYVLQPSNMKAWARPLIPPAT